jgi:hypothetical protein
VDSAHSGLDVIGLMPPEADDQPDTENEAAPEEQHAEERAEKQPERHGRYRGMRLSHPVWRHRHDRSYSWFLTDCCLNTFTLWERFVGGVPSRSPLISEPPDPFISEPPGL